MERILICVLPCMRPKMIGECLRSMAQAKLPQGFDTRLLAFDNDAEESAREAFAAAEFPFLARYAVEPRRGISSARNRALDGASLRFLPKGIAKIIKGVLCSAVAPLCGQAMLRRGVGNLVSGSGLCYGVFAHGNFQKYAKIDGE